MIAPATLVQKELRLALAVGLVGFGFSARTLHLPLILSAGMNVVGVLTRQHEAVRRVLPAAAIVSDLAALLALPRLDLVVIATPNHLHQGQALAALERGKHVVVDKPLALSTSEADAVIQAAARQDRTVAVFQNRRWDSDFLTLRRMLARQQLGTLARFEARWDRYRPVVADRWRERAQCGGGVLYDLGSHLIDQVLCLFGRPDWLQADVFAQREGASVDDGFEILMGKGQLRIALGASSLAADHALRYRVDGHAAGYRKCGLDVQETQLRAGLSPEQADFGVEPQSQWGCLLQGMDAGAAGAPLAQSVPAQRGRWLEFYLGMRHSIEHGAPPPVAAEQARDVLSLIETARRSSSEGRRIAFAEPLYSQR